MRTNRCQLQSLGPRWCSLSKGAKPAQLEGLCQAGPLPPTGLLMAAHVRPAVGVHPAPQPLAGRHERQRTDQTKNRETGGICAQTACWAHGALLRTSSCLMSKETLVAAARGGGWDPCMRLCLQPVLHWCCGFPCSTLGVLHVLLASLFISSAPTHRTTSSIRVEAFPAFSSPCCDFTSEHLWENGIKSMSWFGCKHFGCKIHAYFSHDIHFPC